MSVRASNGLLTLNGWPFRASLLLLNEDEHSNRCLRKVDSEVHPPPPTALCVEIGFYADIFWESTCNIEINGAHFYKSLLVFDVPYRPQVKGMSGKS